VGEEVSVLDATTEAGGRAERRLREEQIAWLATVRSDGQPQSVPVWFFWTARSLAAQIEGSGRRAYPGALENKNASILARPETYEVEVSAYHS
jgi:hypothetical protein